MFDSDLTKKSVLVPITSTLRNSVLTSLTQSMVAHWVSWSGRRSQLQLLTSRFKDVMCTLVHAKDTMVNALQVAMDLHAALPAGDRPELTEGRGLLPHHLERYT